MGIKDKVQSIFCWIDEHSRGMKTVAGLALWAYGRYKGNQELAEIGLYLSGIGTGDKIRRFAQTGSIGHTIDAPVIRKIASIPFRGGSKVPQNKTQERQ